MKRPALLTLLVTAATFVVASPAAADVSCTSSIGATTIDDTLRVPAGASCTLNGTRIDGNVLVEPGARLTADGVHIEGNLQDDDGNAGAVVLRDSTVIGSVQLEQGTSATLLRNDIDSAVQLETNGGALRAERNRIGADLQANANTGGVTITANTIDGNLQCQDNRPAPTGSGNVVHGSAEDQCARLTGGSGGDDGGDDDGGAGFRDVSSRSVHADAIRWLASSGITEGCRADRFCPSAAVTRGQMATFLDRALDLPSGSVAAFRDVPSSHEHAAGIGAIARAELTRGCAADRYCPGDAITRGQMATLLDRALDLPSGDASRFRDVSASSVHAPGIGAIAEAGITRGCDTAGTRFCPADVVTRAQMASFLDAALNR